MAEVGPNPIQEEEDNSHLQIVAVPASPSQENNDNQMEHQFQRTDRWLPVYTWLESLNRDVVVDSNDVLEWLAENPDTREELYSKHSRYHLMHYVKKCHMKVLKRKRKNMGMVSSGMDQNNEGTKGASGTAQQIGSSLRSIPKDSGLYKEKQKEALEKYGLLVEFEKHLLNMMSKRGNPA